MTDSNSNAASLLAAKAFFGTDHPLFSAFGIDVERASPGGAVMTMPCVAELCNHHGATHPGAITTLLDTTCGLAIFAKLGDMRPIATIDLRVDFIAAAAAGESVRSEVACIAVAGDVAYVRGEASGCDSANMLASVSGSFAIGTLGPSFDRMMGGTSE